MGLFYRRTAVTNGQDSRTKEFNQQLNEPLKIS